MVLCKITRVISQQVIQMAIIIIDESLFILNSNVVFS